MRRAPANRHRHALAIPRVAYISRPLTSGGVAPAGACTDGATTAVSYGVDYVRWAAKRDGLVPAAGRAARTRPDRTRLTRWAAGRTSPRC
ncbi:hypothetical protein F8271_23450 [Micromonospora sp. ALFpr18c]|nr:hypothetical protein F8271_23450 [Micromonospora sp. ALFpr18c]